MPRGFGVVRISAECGLSVGRSDGVGVVLNTDRTDLELIVILDARIGAPRQHEIRQVGRACSCLWCGPLVDIGGDRATTLQSSSEADEWDEWDG